MVVTDCFAHSLVARRFRFRVLPRHSPRGVFVLLLGGLLPIETLVPLPKRYRCPSALAKVLLWCAALRPTVSMLAVDGRTARCRLFANRQPFSFSPDNLEGGSLMWPSQGVLLGLYVSRGFGCRKRTPPGQGFHRSMSIRRGFPARLTASPHTSFGNLGESMAEGMARVDGRRGQGDDP